MNAFFQLINIIYPRRCHICSCFLPEDKEYNLSHYICDNCNIGLTPITNPICSICGLPFAVSAGQEHLCETCLRKNPWYDLARAPYLYSGLIAKTIQRFKYKSGTYLAPFFGTLLSAFAKELIHNPKDITIVPVPLHRRRLRERGFNQSLLLAKGLASGLGAKLDYLSLIRKRNTRVQTGLGKEERRKNVKNAFSVINRQAINDKKILMIDDVFTTGHTLNECSRTLKESGASYIVCLTLARTSLD